jgi:VRR-NUC domain-containing protein
MSIPLHILKLMSSADRARYFPEESVGPEAAEQGKFARWLKAQWELGRLEYFWQRVDKKASGKPGTPDFIVALPNGKVHWIEFKSADGTLSVPQAATLKNLARLGHSTSICHSGTEAIALVARTLDIV